MKAIRYHEAGSIEVLEEEEIDRPDPGHGEVLVEVRAASVNPIDAKIRAKNSPTVPKTTGSDLAGVIVSVGDGVDEYESGDRVFATGLHAERFAGGSFAEFAVVPTDLLTPLPDAVSFKEGAAIALVGVTAWLALVEKAGVVPGTTALVHGGNGGVGHVAIGLANAMGVTPVATARPEHHAAVRGMGADVVLDYARDDLARAAKDATGGADLVLDHRPGEYINTDVDVAAFDGDVVLIAGENMTLTTIGKARSKELKIHLMSMSNLVTNVATQDIGPILRRLGHLLAVDRLDVRIDRTYPLSEAAEAHKSVIQESVVGKIVVTP
jgi:NADPH:quinone reductase-like Zn-dependent oxidoreductase